MTAELLEITLLGEAGTGCGCWLSLSILRSYTAASRFESSGLLKLKLAGSLGLMGERLPDLCLARLLNRWVFICLKVKTSLFRLQSFCKLKY